MHLRVRFRFRADTGEVEIFRVEDVADEPRQADHDARHERATSNLARIIDPHALIIEEDQGAVAEPAPQEQHAPQSTETPTPAAEPTREGPQR
jgi:hypothetical protein